MGLKGLWGQNDLQGLKGYKIVFGIERVLGSLGVLGFEMVLNGLMVIKGMN